MTKDTLVLSKRKLLIPTCLPYGLKLGGGSSWLQTPIACQTPTAIITVAPNRTCEIKTIAQRGKKEIL